MRQYVESVSTYWRRIVVATALVVAVPLVAATVKGNLTLNEINLYEVTGDPSVSPGVPAPQGTVAMVDGRGIWQKTGALDTDWTVVISPTVGGAGVVPPFVMSKSGNATVGTYLMTGEAVTSLTGQLIKGSNYIVSLDISNGSNVASTTRVQIQRRTGVSTFTDISGAYVDIPSGNYKGTNAISVAIGPDEEISSYVQSGSTLHDPILTIFCTPQ